MNKTIKIAIDGPSGAGKSTIAKALASSLSLTYIDTGAMYRAAALYVIRQNIDIKTQPHSVADLLSNISISITHRDGMQRIILNGEDVEEKIRTAELSIGASDIGTIPAVREYLGRLQRKIAETRDVIMDGRDIGTVILHDADVKIFLTASLESRAQRRYLEILQKGGTCDFESVKKDMEYRDINDSTREIAPLKPAEDAILLDTSDFTLEQSIALVEKTIKENLGDRFVL